MRSRALKDILLGLVVSALCLLGIELALRASGLGTGSGEANFSRGFDRAASYFSPIEQTPGGFKTNFYPDPKEERTVSPKGARHRVLLFGGSNTNGFPTGELANDLRDLAGRGKFEVINLGRRGYGSERVQIIYEQALAKLSPDLMLIYCGHNEFVERGFQMDLGERQTPGPLTQWAYGTTTFRALVDHFESEEATREAPAQTEPDAWKWEYDKFKDITYDETRQYYDAYEQNVRQMCETAVADGVNVLLSTVIYNRLSVPFSSTFPQSVSESARAEFETLRQEALLGLPDYLTPLLPESEQARVHGYDWGYGWMPPRENPMQLAGWRPTTGLLGHGDRRSPRKGKWKPAVHELDVCLQRFHAREPGSSSREKLEQTEALLERALRICPDHPRALFELAVTQFLLGRDSAAYVKNFEDAAQYDRAPRKATALTNEILRQIADDIEGVTLFDADGAFRECHPDELVGWEWMTDHCHLHFGGYVSLMEAFAPAIVSTAEADRD